jgi:hypothetical protein
MIYGHCPQDSPFTRSYTAVSQVGALFTVIVYLSQGPQPQPRPFYRLGSSTLSSDAKIYDAPPQNSTVRTVPWETEKGQQVTPIMNQLNS